MNRITQRDIDGGPAQNPRGVQEGHAVCLLSERSRYDHPIGKVRAIDPDGRYALVVWASGHRSHHTLRELAPA